MASWSGISRGRTGRALRRALMVALLTVAAAPLGWPGEARAQSAGASLERFCARWMELLKQREADNRARMRWQPSGDGVQGEYVGYSRDYTCRLGGRPGAPPVGIMSYRELRYRESGPTPAEALERPPEVVDVTEVVEIFRYAGGRWVY